MWLGVWLPDEELLGDLGAGDVFWHVLEQHLVTLLLAEVRVRAELDQLSTLPVLSVYPLGRSHLVGSQVLAHQLHVTVHSVGDVVVDVVGGAQQLEGRDLAIEQLQAVSYSLTVARGDLQEQGVWLYVDVTKGSWNGYIGNGYVGVAICGRGCM